MNIRFFGTAGICSAIFIVIATIFIFLWGVGVDSIWSCKTAELMKVLGCACFLLPIAFWLVVGAICSLDAVWGWGLVL